MPPDPAFVLGVPRSGTTLLRLMLAGHSRLFSPPEMVLAPFETMAERHAVLERRFWERGGLRRTFMELEGLDADAAKRRVDGLIDRNVREVYETIQRAIGDRILVDKCPHLCGAPDALRRLNEWFPHARFLVILRHPASVLGSLKHVNIAEQLATAYGAPEEVWLRGTRTLLDFTSSLPPERWTLFKYEDLMRDAQPVMQQICTTLGIDVEPELFTPYDGDRMRSGPRGANATGDPNTAARDRIEPELADRWLETFDHRSVGDETKRLAATLGYDLEAVPLPAVTQVSSAIGSLFDTVRQLEASIDLPIEPDALEGRRFLLRLTSAAIDTLTEEADPDHPRWHRFIGPTRKLFGDCPDCDYLRAPIRVGPGRAYELTGRIAPGTTYLGFVLHGRGGRLGAAMHAGDVRCDARGAFRLRISHEPDADLKCDGDETEIVVRQYFADRKREHPAELALALVGSPPVAAPLAAHDYAQGLHRAERMVKAVFGRIRDAYQLATKLPSKQFVTLPGESLFPTPDNTYQACWYRFGPGQAFLIRGRVPTARYFSVCLYNAWMESHDYTVRRVSLNHAEIETDGAGDFTIVLADGDPGMPNWLDTGGHHAGYVLARSLLLDGPPPQLATDTIWLARPE
jgi:hypothetical protein